MATYRGPTQADVLRQFNADSERARAAGYTPVSQAWAQENGEEVMRVRFSRAEGVTPPPPVTPPATPPPAVAPSWGAPAAAGSGGSSSGGGLRTAIIVGAVVVLLLAGLGAIGLANSPQPSTALATSTPTAAQATATSTPAATPTATATAAASEGTSATETDQWLAFVGYVGDTMPTLAGQANALADAANAGDVDGVVEQANNIEDTTNEVIDYLDSHPPADCYADVHAATRSAIDEYRTAAVAAGKRDFDTAATHMDEANTQIELLPDMLTGTSADCLS
jgi:hypothetical protein